MVNSDKNKAGNTVALIPIVKKASFLIWHWMRQADNLKKALRFPTIGENLRLSLAFWTKQAPGLIISLFLQRDPGRAYRKWQPRLPPSQVLAAC